jgi:flagellar basal body-associated protein FliL
MTNEPNFEGDKMKAPSSNISVSAEDITIKESKGTFIIIMVAALLVILVGLFFWYKSTQTMLEPVATPVRPTAEMNQEPETTTAEAQVDSFSALSTSDELGAIEADLESTNLTNLEIELQQIDAELEASVQ